MRARLVGYTRAERGPRPATERELRALEAMLEASLAAEEGRGPGDLGRAIGAHREARERRVEREEVAADAEGRPGRSRQRSASTAAADGPADGDRSTSCVAAPAGPGLRVFRRLDDYEAAIAQVELGAVAPGPGEPDDTALPNPGAVKAERRVDAEAERGACVPASTVR